MFGKQVFAEPCRHNGMQSRLWSRSPASPYSLQMSLVIGISQEQVLDLNFFRQLEERSKFLPESFGPWLFSAWNNLHTKETFWSSKVCSCSSHDNCVLCLVWMLFKPINAVYCNRSFSTKIFFSDLFCYTVRLFHLFSLVIKMDFWSSGYIHCYYSIWSTLFLTWKFPKKVMLFDRSKCWQTVPVFLQGDGREYFFTLTLFVSMCVLLCKTRVYPSQATSSKRYIILKKNRSNCDMTSIRSDHNTSWKIYPMSSYSTEVKLEAIV